MLGSAELALSSGFKRLKLYKYCGDWGASVLDELKLKVTPPNEFNDIFEFTPTFRGASPLKWAEASEIPRHSGAIRQSLAARGKIFEGRDDEFCDFLKKVAKQPIYASSNQISEMCSDVLDHISKTTGIICFSKRKNNLLMWSHYADDHTGIVIGFDIPPHLSPKKPPLEVHYDRRRLPWRLTLEMTSAECVNEVRKLILTKSLHWRAEKEVRWLWSLEGLEKEDDKQSNKPQYFTRIPAAIISDVYFGYRCRPELRARVRAKIESSELQTRCWQAEQSPTHYALRFRALDPLV